MKFDKLYCNGAACPLGTGTEITLSWNYASDYRRGVVQFSFRLLLSESRSFDTLCYDSGIVYSDEMRFPLAHKYQLQRGTRYYWRVIAELDGETVESEIACFETAEELTTEAEWIACAEETEGAVSFSKTVSLGGVSRARAYVYGLGFATLKINGKPCSGRLMAPSNSVYENRCLYDTYDIGSLLREGENTLEIICADGYGKNFSKWGWRYMTGKGCAALFTFTGEGGKKRVATDESWKGSETPVRNADIYNGELYDASIGEFKPVEVKAKPDERPKGKFIPDEMPALRVVEKIEPVSARQRDGSVIFDFGVNIAGVVRVRVKGKRGDRIKINHAELISPDGGLDFTTNRGAKAEDVYICSGDGVECWNPTFTYHGFRYASIEAGGAELLEAAALRINAEVEKAGEFNCSEEIINRIHKNAVCSLLGNMVSIPTDCTMRDERTPCQMDSQTEEEARMFNFNAQSYYDKWLADISYTDGGNPDWFGDRIALMRRLYSFYGDKAALEANYDSAKSLLNSFMLESDKGSGLRPDGFGDWCNPNENTWESYGGSKLAVNTTLFYSCCVEMKAIALVLEKAEDAALFGAMGEKVKKAFTAHSFKEDGSIETGRQTEQIMPLYYGMLDEKQSAEAFGALQRRVADDGRLDTGIYGTSLIVDVFAANGCVNDIFKLLRSCSFPSFGWQTVNGATSLWEQWAYKGGMHSHNHAMFAGIDASFYRVLGGITPLERGFRRIRIKPCVPDGMSHVFCSYQSASGLIEIEYSAFEGGRELRVVIPPNVSAKLEMDADGYEVFDGELPVTIPKSLGSGRYNFRFVLPALVYRAD